MSRFYDFVAQRTEARETAVKVIWLAADFGISDIIPFLFANMGLLIEDQTFCTVLCMCAGAVL